MFLLNSLKTQASIWKPSCIPLSTGLFLFNICQGTHWSHVNYNHSLNYNPCCLHAAPGSSECDEAHSGREAEEGEYLCLPGRLIHLSAASQTANLAMVSTRQKALMRKNTVTQSACLKMCRLKSLAAVSAQASCCQWKAAEILPVWSVSRWMICSMCWWSWRGKWRD